MRAGTLALRLTLAASAWALLAVLVAGVLLLALFRGHIERRFDAALADHLEELVAATEIAPGGEPVLRWTPSDPRFNRPRSGWYWQVGAAGATTARSRSLWREELSLAPAPRPTRIATSALDGPGGEALRASVQHVALPGADAPIAFAVAGPIADVERDVASFRNALALTLAALGVGLVATVAATVRFGLAPLARIGRAVAAVRAGRERRLPEDVPGEIRPLVREVNALLDHDDALIARARGAASDLAHALKTPLTVIRNETRDVDAEAGARVREQSERIARAIDRHLSRARAAVARDVPGARVDVGEVVRDLAFSLDRLHRARGVRIVADEIAIPAFRGDGDDLAEMLGNLMDNACKWARCEVRVTGAREGDALRLRVDDDGPGLGEAQRRAALERGARLDESVPGSGLGLAITVDLARMYGGDLELGASPSGGLRATLRLPAAD